MKKLFVALSAFALSGCVSTPEVAEEVEPIEYETVSTVRLTVAEGKRLIAKGLLANEAVQSKLAKGMVIITRGTTNTYIAEEFVDFAEPHGAFVTGKITPHGQADFSKDIAKREEIVIVDGKVVDMSYKEALAQAKDGDIVFKGGNMLNYELGQAGVCIGRADAGTVGAFAPYLSSGAVSWVLPIGLEKDSSFDLQIVADMLAHNTERRNRTTLLWVTDAADIYTEIEAIREFADVDIMPIATGGVSGAEGGVSLLLCGSKAEVQKATEAVESVLGEEPFVR